MSDYLDDEAFVDDTSSDAGTEEGSDIFSDGQDPFYDRSPWFILVGRLVTTHDDDLNHHVSHFVTVSHVTLHRLWKRGWGEECWLISLRGKY